MKAPVIKWTTAATFALLGCGCNLILGLEPRDLIVGAGGAGGTGGSTVTSSSSTSVSCSDGVENGAETDKDCGGGTCLACKNGQGCKTGPDCESHFCNGGTCLAPTCDDKTKNGNETDTDCGGSDCPQCGPDKQCVSKDDCVSGACSGGKCTSTCTDGLKGGKETDADCGGGDCPTCADSKMCKVSTDCQSGLCKLNGCVGATVWSKALGGPGANDSTNVSGVAIGLQSDAAIFGSFLGQADLGAGLVSSAGSDDAFVTKLGPGGNVLWSKQYGDAQSQAVFSATVDTTGATYVTGRFQGNIDLGGGPLTSAGGDDIFVAKIDTTGNNVWRMGFGDAANQFGVGVAPDTSGNAYVSGILQGSANFGGAKLTSKGLADVFLVKFGPGGAHVWSKSFGDAAGQYVAGIAVDGAGDVVILGYFAGTINFGAPTATLTSAGGYDVFLAKFDTAGTPKWSQRFGDAKDQLASGVALDAAGDIVIVGSLSGTADFGMGLLTSAGKEDVFVAKFDPAGTSMWSNTFGGANKDQFVGGVTVDSAGAISIATYFNGDIDFGGGALVSAGANDVAVAKFDSAGAHVWSKSFGDAQNQTAAGIAAYDTQHLMLAGNFSGILNFGATPLVNGGGQDAFLVKLVTP